MVNSWAISQRGIAALYSTVDEPCWVAILCAGMVSLARS